MKLIRTKLIGTGIPSDPYRCELPTYTMVLATPSLTQCIVSVPDEALPSGIDWTKATLTNVPTIGDVVTAHNPAELAKLTSGLKKMYQEVQSKIGVNIV